MHISTMDNQLVAVMRNRYDDIFHPNQSSVAWHKKITY